MHRDVKRLTVDRGSIEFSVAGEGEPILVFHGGHSNCYEEFGFQKLVESGFQLITPSRPGYGKTSKEIGESLEASCIAYEAIITHLGLEKVHVLAISAGGPVGIFFASRYPERVRTLTLQSAVTKEWLTPADKEYKAARVLFRPSVEKYTWRMISLLNNRFPQFLFKNMAPSFSTLSYKKLMGKLNAEDIEEFRKMNNRQRSGAGFLIDLEQTKTIKAEDLAAVKCPAIIMQSKFDGFIPLAHAEHAHNNIPASKLVVLDSWGHLIWLGKEADKAHTTVINFLRANTINDKIDKKATDPKRKNMVTKKD
ncbi:alpha/beta fold hydrolase [Pseudalkalibacillus caeni]|uniref:Alpha/beta hydrolase n=1 Tax=Exobacillus caeni TaxID=2574798 RepID=A0A5R9F037_9BACL|nr:alpha/beta hydrolase [Pseudalkalibacillus caeni]TLS36059.1 alpha/beta hydrolase [Pseudalkalibacillus caeni]